MRAPLQWTWLLIFCCLAACEDHQISNILANAVEGVTASTTATATVTHSSEGANLNLGKPLAPKDCADVAKNGWTRSGVYRVWARGGYADGMLVYCDLEQDEGGWTVIQRRGQFGNPVDYFFRRWRDYKFGFGNLEKEFWLGNDNIYSLSNQDNYVLRVNLKDHSNETRYAQYDEFYIEDETKKYRLWIELYKGDANDSMAYNKGMFFSTMDRDNDQSSGNCAVGRKGAWWFNGCSYSNPNGPNHNGPHTIDYVGINWYHWKGAKYSYREVEMKIKPKTYP